MREDIEKYLGTVMESTAKTIASRLGLPQLDVSRDLNAMVKDGTLEREMKKGEYTYWLTRSDTKPAAKVANGVDMHPTALPAGVVSVPKESPAVDEKPEVAVAKTDGVITGITVTHGGPAEPPRPSLFELDRLQEKFAASESRASNLQSKLDAALAEVESQKEVIAKLRENTAALERSIDDLTGVADVELPKVYVTVGKYVKPKRHADLPRAQRRAATLVRTEKESEVLVCAPVGRMVRGSEWKSQ